jgi:nicotinamide riboside transporter PnuC
MIDWLWLVTLASLIGTVANIYKKAWGFLLWLFTSATWTVVDYRMENYPQAGIFFVYMLLSVWGLWRWRTETHDWNARGGV